MKDRATAKFDETIEMAMNLGVDPRHADQMVRGVVIAAHGTGKTVRVAVFAKGDKAEEAKAAGADIVGAEDLAEQIQGGQIDFDRCIATPDMMAAGRPARQGARPARPDAEPEARHGDARRRRGGQGRQGRRRSSSASRRPASSMPASARPASREDGAGRERPRVRRRGEPGQAVGRQGHLCEARVAQLDHGPRREARSVEPGRRAEGGAPAE